jgi:hypothetical protein
MNNTKKWIFKYRYLQLELDETKEKQDNYTKKFMEDFHEVLVDEKNQEGINNASEEGKQLIDAISDEVKPKNKSKLAKELYRNISRKTHPDVTKDEDMNNIFSEAADAYEELNLMELIMLSDKLGIDISSEIDDKDLQMVQTNCEQVQVEIDTIKSTLTWQWCTTPEENKEELKEYFIGLLVR